MIARIQTAWVAFLLLCSTLWLGFAWPRSPALAVGGVMAGTLLYLAVMALEFMLMQRVNRHDRAPAAPAPATVPELGRAWWAEVRVAVRVFCWDQPFRSRAEPDWLPAQPTGQRGVVLVHGFMCNRAVWRPWFAPLERAGHAFEALNLEPVLGSIDAYAAQIDAAVQRVHAATGMAPVLVCHSMGGLAARAWLRAGGESDESGQSGQSGQSGRVQRVVTLGTPHRGTWLARRARSGNRAQMALDSDWSKALARAESSEQARLFTCWYSNCDNVVFPASSATLPGADNRLVQGLAHVQMARHPSVLHACLQLLTQSATKNMSQNGL